MGAYRGDDGKPFVLDSVRKAEKLVLDKSLNHEYAGIAGKLNEHQYSCGARVRAGNACTVALLARACPVGSERQNTILCSLALAMLFFRFPYQIT